MVAIGGLRINWDWYGLTWRYSKQAVSGRILPNVYQRDIVKLLHIILRYFFWVAALWCLCRLSQIKSDPSSCQHKSSALIRYPRISSCHRISNKFCRTLMLQWSRDTIRELYSQLLISGFSCISRLITLQTQIVFLRTLRDFAYMLTSIQRN